MRGDELPAPMREAFEAGRALREPVPREAHAVFEPRPGRPDPVAVLEAQAATRVPELVPIRYGRMIVSPFTFFRGGAAIMAWDLAHEASAPLRVQACGDAHLSNFGVFAAPDRRLVFDLNDFDETLPAPFDWDLKRLAASIVVAARDNGFGAEEERAAASEAVAEYQRVMDALLTWPFLAVWYARVEADQLPELFARDIDGKLGARLQKRVDKGLAKAQRRTSLGALARFAEHTPDGYRIKPDPPVVVTIDPAELQASRELVDHGLADYAATLAPDRRVVFERYRFVDLARKVVGVGSVGTEALMLLLMGNGDADPLFLQLKEAQASVLEPYAGASAYDQHGERVVQGQRIMQSSGDALLGWLTGTGAARRHFYVRQLRDMKGSAEVGALKPDGLTLYARACGGTLARAHARSGDVGAISGYCGTGARFRDAITEFACAYADQNELDHAALLAAEADGRLEVRRGV